MARSSRRLPARALAFRRRLLGWYRRHKRDLPWRGHADPWAVLVSEVMLQQTQVSRVVDHWTRFLARYPTLEDLAAAAEDHVCDSWAGLGYYARARNLHAAARAVVRDHAGVLPRDPAALGRLPGIGRYTAAAVASLAFGAPVATVDTNVERVLARVFAVRGHKGEAARTHRVWALASALVPARRSGDWNQALMDLGATICTARSPRCERCPVEALCRGSRLRRRRPSPASGSRR